MKVGVMLGQPYCICHDHRSDGAHSTQGACQLHGHMS
jgi:hypothetical protein